MVLVGPLAHVPPRLAEDGGGRHHVDAIDAGQVHSRHAEQGFTHVKLRGMALLASAPPLAGLLRHIGPRAAVGPLLQTRTSRKAARACGSRSPARMALTMACPVTPLKSLITLAKRRFIGVSTLCIRWMC